MSECGCGSCGHKHSFFTSWTWKLSVLGVSLAALIASYFFWDALADANRIFMYFNPAWIAVILSGHPIVFGAIRGLFVDKKITSALLITVALMGTITLEILNWFGVTGGGHDHEKFLFAAGEIAFLMSLGELLEEFTVRRSNAGIEKLIALSPKTAWLMRDGRAVQVSIDSIRVNDIVLIKPNEKISVDGVILSGETSVDTSAITGESVPQDVKADDNVFAGTWNKYGAIEVKVTKASNETAVSRMIELVKAAQEKKAPIAKLADRWASYIVPCAIVIAIGVLLLTRFAFSLDWSGAFVRCVTILVVFCPCALALATPTAVAAGIGNAAGRGIIVKSGQALEIMSKVNVAAFDKTGTLTTAQLTVENVITFGFDRQEMIKLLGSCELASEHPVSKAIVNYAKQFGELVKPQQTQSFVGTGVKALVEGKTVVAARWSYFEKQINEKHVKANELNESGLTVIGVSIDSELCGAVVVADKIKANAASAVEGLKSIGIESVMLTGDNKVAASHIAAQCSIAEVKHSLLPEDKTTAIEELKASGKTVCMIGDGVNDAPSLASANVSVAMGSIGSDVALEVADMTILNSDIGSLKGLFKLSRRVLGTIKRNIVISMAINIAAVVLSTLGTLGPVGGALLHNASSVFVVSSSALLLLGKK